MDKRKILVVDDDGLVARMCELMLRDQGYDVMVALGGQEALDMIEKSTPDLILLDIMMPGKDGISIIEMLKQGKETARIPVIVSTNLSGESDIKLALGKGASDYVVKRDMKPEILKTKIDKVLVEKKN